MARGRYDSRGRRNHVRRPGRGRRRHGRSLISKLLIGSAIVLIPVVSLGTGGYLAWEYVNTEHIDVAYCYERDDQYQVAVFVDYSLTHQISQSQQRDLINTLLQTYRRMPPNGKISIFTTATDTTASINDPVFELCRPSKNAREQKRIDAPKKSITVLKREHDEANEAFEAYVSELIAQSVDSSKIASSSPILEQIQGISRYDFGVPLSKLIVASDGINNSSNGQFCTVQGELPSFEKWAQRPRYPRIQPDDFGGADVNFQMFENGADAPVSGGFCTWNELHEFWIAYFEANGAGNVRLTPLGPGAG